MTGILTAADLTHQFGDMARPFVLIEEAENRLRRAAEIYEVDELRDAVSPSQRKRVNKPADLTFGTYRYLLNDEKRWAMLGWKVDKGILLSPLEDVRKIRNELMHFASDPISPEQYATVNGLLAILRTVDPGL